MRKKKYNFAVCMKHRCDECRQKDKCFKERGEYNGEDNKRRKSTKKFQRQGK